MRILTVAVGILAGRALAAEAPPAPGPAVLTYAADLELEYRDILGKAPNGTPPAPTAAGAVLLRETPRSLGLKRACVALDWRTQNASSLHLTLRPDALSREPDAGGVVREADSRAGDNYRPQPTLRLLDAYHVTIYPVSSLSTSVGVFEELAPQRQSYPVGLDFGLRVQLPSKFAAVRLRWQDVRNGPDLSAPSSAGTLLADAYVLDGVDGVDGDRVEGDDRDVRKRGAFDVAPVGADPFLGGAATLSYQPVDAVEVGAVVGTVDAKPDSSLNGAGKRSEIFGQLIAVTRLAMASSFPTTLSLDLRTSSEKWRGTPANLPKPSARDQRSASLTVSTRAAPQAWVLAGVNVGKSERALTAGAPDRLSSLNGFEVEAGVLGNLGSDLSLQLLLSTEKRTVQGGGRDGGWFTDADGSTHKTMRRYGLLLSYDLHEKA